MFTIKFALVDVKILIDTLSKKSEPPLAAHLSDEGLILIG